MTQLYQPQGFIQLKLQRNVVVPFYDLLPEPVIERMTQCINDEEPVKATVTSIGTQST